MMFLHILRPNPVPFLFICACSSNFAKSVNNFGKFSGEIPRPLSSMMRSIFTYFSTSVKNCFNSFNSRSLYFQNWSNLIVTIEPSPTQWSILMPSSRKRTGQFWGENSLKHNLQNLLRFLSAKQNVIPLTKKFSCAFHQQFRIIWILGLLLFLLA